MLEFSSLASSSSFLFCTFPNIFANDSLLVKIQTLPGSLPIFTHVDDGKVKNSVTLDRVILAKKCEWEIGSQQLIHQMVHM